MYDPDLYRTKEEIAAWKERDPIAAFTARVTAAGLFAADDVARLEENVAAEIAAAVAAAEAGPWEPVEDLLKDVHAAP